MTEEGQQDPDNEIAEPDQSPPLPVATTAEFHYPFGSHEAPTQLAAPTGSPKLTAKKTYIYAVICAGLGILAGVVIADHYGSFDRVSGPNDLGLVSSDADGLKGHLITNWDGKLEYRLTIVPGDPEQRAGFSMAVTNSPRPVAFDIQLKDPLGFVLCGGTIALKFDPTKTQALAAGASQPQGGQAKAAQAARDQTAQGEAVARSEAQEANREQGKNIFQNDIGKDGAIESITAQGELPCSKKAYARAVSWSYTSNFPSLAEQAQLSQPPQEAAVSEAAAPSAPSAVRKRATAKAPTPPVSYSIEGDDDIMEFDVARGVISTITGKVYFIDKKSAESSAPAWQDFPVRIHYVCNQATGCTLMHAGAGVLHVRMSR